MTKTHGPIITPNPMNKRSRKTLLKRKEDDENIGFTNGNVSKKDVKIICIICSEENHNKRYHRVQVSVVLCACFVEQICITPI